MTHLVTQEPKVYGDHPSHLTNNQNLDGLDQSEAFKLGKEVRKDVLLELFTDQESHDGSESIAFRKGRYKLVKGNIRDPHWYKEPTEDRVNTTDTSFFHRFIEAKILNTTNYLYRHIAEPHLDGGAKRFTNIHEPIAMIIQICSSIKIRM